MSLDNKEVVIGLAGNPNTGKSTVFNALTGMRQHTGNWSGKTVVNARGYFTRGERKFTVYDLPGIYSLLSDSAEERCAKEFICFEKPDITVVVVDATCLERNLPLVLQVMELMDEVVVCLNLMDEAKKKGVVIDVPELEKRIGVPVVCTSARQGEGMEELKELLLKAVQNKVDFSPARTVFNDSFQKAVNAMEESGSHLIPHKMPVNYFFSQVIEENLDFYEALKNKEGYDDVKITELLARGELARKELEEEGVSVEVFQREKSLAFLKRAEEIASDVVEMRENSCRERERKLDRIILSKRFGIPFMLLLLGAIFWITIAGANVPSQMLMELFLRMGERFGTFLNWCGTPPWLYGLLKDGIFLTVSWVVAVMLPPMAIFFPLFTLLEDFGLLPRIAFNLDGLFQKANAHGKQVLTMCMGFGCNAAGITSCRIIETPRERLIAILTNNFVPCNGRFPTIIMLAGIFFAGGSKLGAGIFVLLAIAFSVVITLIMSKILSVTCLKGIPSSFTLELPPYRKPQIGRVIVRSMIDRTAFVLGRAVSVAIPAGAVIWVLQNITVGDMTLIGTMASAIDPLGKLMGMSGMILMAFILGMPANEIVIPIMLMCYCQSGALLDATSTAELGKILVANGWTWVTALCTVLFTLNHFPCGTTLLTIKKETGSWKWTFVSFLIPTITGIVLCCGVNGMIRFIQMFL